MSLDHPTRAVPVFAERGAQRRVMGATDWWFYPLILVLAAALVALSLGITTVSQPPQPQPATRKDGALVYGPHQLARGTRIDATHVRYIVRDLGLSASAVRLAVRPGTAIPADGDSAAALLLAPGDTEALVGRPVRVEIAHRRFSISAAGALALRFDNGPWTITPLPPQSGPLTVTLPAPSTAPRELGIRMVTDQQDMNYGAEFNRIVLRPVP
jgi:hypothetical protein